MSTLQQRVAKLLAGAGITIDGQASGDVRVVDDRIYRRVVVGGSLALGDGYVDNWWESTAVDVTIDKILRAKLDRNVGMLGHTLFALRDRLLNLQTVQRSLEVGRVHYDVGNALYERMLGSTMGYSSGYYGDGARTHDDAQIAKFDRICRVLGLKPGMKVLEIGAGFGTFAEHAAKHYGVTVAGLSISKEQIAYARTRCANLPVEIRFLDYRHLPAAENGTYDAVVSIEMIEAVGRKNVRDYFSVIRRALKPTGRACVQAIIGEGADPWISTRIFPNGALPSQAQIARATEGLLRLKAYESFAEDYDKTLIEWHRRFVSAWPELRELKNADGTRRYDARFYRMWEYYLLGCAGTFRSGIIDVAQLVFVPEKEPVSLRG